MLVAAKRFLQGYHVGLHDLLVVIQRSILRAVGHGIEYGGGDARLLRQFSAYGLWILRFGEYRTSFFLSDGLVDFTKF